MTQLLIGIKSLLVAFVLIGAVPLVVANYQYLLVGLHFLRLHYRDCEPWLPRTAVLIPAWNEQAVIGASVDRLMRLQYPRESLRIFVVDDASTDATPQVIQAKAEQYPGNVFHLRRERGGEGKAATLNHGLGVILADDWMQAVLIMDADVIYEPDSLRKMTRHLADPRIGSVTAFIKEGSQRGNYMNRFIGYEYITAQGAARRSQEVLGVIACLAGGAQLHSRENIEAVGGRIDNSSLAEDTVTTFKTQRAGRMVIFEPHATVWAEEPGSVVALWKQRLRWARGNVQVTKMFADVWFRPNPTDRLGSISFGLIWFCLLLLPALMMLASASLVILYFIGYQLAWTAFHVLWLANVITYVFITPFTLLIDPATGRRTWRQALLFPGAVNVVILLAAVLPGPLYWVAHQLCTAAGFSITHGWVRGIQLFTYIWLSGCMAVAYLAKVVEPRPLGRFLSEVLVYLSGFGPLLCAVTTAAYVQEFRGAEQRWDKTEKTGKMVAAV
jgi:cellulose synthase/poly-beta-1,6-N-acetylglucosamine synthase-like glycosyltransferase